VNSIQRRGLVNASVAAVATFAIGSAVVFAAGGPEDVATPTPSASPSASPPTPSCTPTWDVVRSANPAEVPTTLLAQVDASVGGKVAINHARAKNLIGAFHQPRLVLIDPETLGTLPEREYRSGLAEVIKTGAALNADLFGILETSIDALRRRDAALLESVVATCCAEKTTIVEQDEREESGLRMILNYGHTVGHALEALGGYQTWLHGEAVAVGMAAAARLATRLGLTDARTAERQLALLGAVGLPTRFETPSPGEVAEVLRRDKKARDGRVPFVLLKALGRAEVCFDVPSEVVREVLDAIHGGSTSRPGPMPGQ